MPRPTLRRLGNNSPPSLTLSLFSFSVPLSLSLCLSISRSLSLTLSLSLSVCLSLALSLSHSLSLSLSPSFSSCYLFLCLSFSLSLALSLSLSLSEGGSSGMHDPERAPSNLRSRKPRSRSHAPPGKAVYQQQQQQQQQQQLLQSWQASRPRFGFWTGRRFRTVGNSCGQSVAHVFERACARTTTIMTVSKLIKATPQNQASLHLDMLSTPRL